MEEMMVVKIVERDNEWLDRNFEKVQKEHPNRFVAVFGSHVLAMGEDSENVMKEVKGKSVDPSTTLIEFILERGVIRKL